jgi:hypothetical protein
MIKRMKEKPRHPYKGTRGTHKKKTNERTAYYSSGKQKPLCILSVAGKEFTMQTCDWLILVKLPKE